MSLETMPAFNEIETPIDILEENQTKNLPIYSWIIYTIVAIIASLTTFLIIIGSPFWLFSLVILLIVIVLHLLRMPIMYGVQRSTIIDDNLSQTCDTTL
jgi:uncharacterized membrane protein